MNDEYDISKNYLGENDSTFKDILLIKSQNCIKEL
jgi:hypothetical protein